MVCYLSKCYKSVSSAGNKAKTDIERIMDSLHYTSVGFKRSVNSNQLISFFLTLGSIIKFPFYLHKGDILVLQYPLKKYYKYVCWISHLKGAKIVTQIHDLGSFRRRKLTVEQEIKRLNNSDYIITHNIKMSEWLKKHGCKAKLGELEIFDYLSETKNNNYDMPSSLPCNIVYVGGGSIKDNSFLYNLNTEKYKLELYGGGFDESKIKDNPFFCSHGFVQSDKLIATTIGHWGLVWYGDSISECGGSIGNYLKYINPHKASLYIRCGLPIITWSHSALAYFVKQNKIGLVVENMNELDQKISEITSENYSEMKRNVSLINNRLSEGYYFAKAVKQAVEILNG